MSLPTTVTKTTHSLFSLGNLISEIMNMINVLKEDAEEWNTSKNKIGLLEDTVKYLSAEMEKIVSGTSNPLPVPAILNQGQTQSQTSSSS
jgi:hypothetical protein